MPGSRNHNRFLLEPTARPLPTPDDDAAEAATAVSSTLASTEQPEDENGDGEPPTKKIRLSGAEKKRRARQEAADKRKDKKKGMNTNRKFARVQDEVQLCFKAAVGEPCDFGARWESPPRPTAPCLTHPDQLPFRARHPNIPRRKASRHLFSTCLIPFS